MPWKRRIFAPAALLFCGLAGPAFALDSGPAPGAPKWAPWVEFGGFYGSDESSRAEGALWVPLTQGQTSLLFGEARGKLFEDDMREGNFALGYRQMMPGGWNLGFWGGYDIRESSYGNTFHQLAGGIEALSGNWDFRANAYLPLNETESVFSTTSSTASGAVDFSGNQIGMTTTIETMTSRMDEVALWGFDGEVGYKLFATPDDLLGPRHEFRVYAGAFHFDHSDLPESVTGPRLRAEWRMDDILDGWGGSRLTFEGEYSHDDLRDDRFEVGARLRLPFGADGTRTASSRLLTAQERRMTEGLERDTDIVTDTKVTSKTASATITEGVEDARTGVHFDRVETVDASGDLTTVSATAGANTLIIADGRAGAFGGDTPLQGDQTIMGGDTAIQVRGQTSGTVVDFTAPGTKPVFSFTAIDDRMTVSASNTHVSGIEIDGNLTSRSSLTVGTGARNVVLADLRIVDGQAVYSTLRVEAGASVTVDRVHIDSDRGIQLRPNAAATITNSFIDAGSYGIAVLADSVATINGTSIVGALTWTGLDIDSNSIVNGSGNVAGPNFTCKHVPGTGWTGSIEFSGTTYTYATNCSN